MSFAMYLDMEEENLIQNCIPPYHVSKYTDNMYKVPE